ncbi:hypothetical protein [Streptomyces daliensis]
MPFESRLAAPAVALPLLAAACLLQLLGIVLAAAAPVAAGALLAVLLEVLMLRRRWRGLGRRLGRIQLSATVRHLVRDGLLLVGLARLDALHPVVEGVPLLAAMLGYWGLHFVCQAVAGRVRLSRRLPVVTRNIDASALNLTPAPPPLFGRQSTLRLAGVGLLTTVGMAATALTGYALWGALAAGACCVALLAGVGHLAGWLLPSRRPVGEAEALAWLDAWLAEYRPTIGMYFSGGTASAYQANMWLSTLAELDGRPVIVLRERFMVQKLDATDIPVLCVPRVAHLMRLEHSTLRVLLHPANSGKTSQVLRIPTIKHAFINHGESDKLSSCNPYAKAYDEVWVAGAAARERYQSADIGVEDKDVVEVGRPQLAPIHPYEGPPVPGGTTTVLYAPTWEGWTDDPGNTSVVLAGEAIVRALLADPAVRLLYKPHPMTGSVDPRAAEADQRIRELVREASAARAAERGERNGGAEGAGEGAAELERRRAELEALTTCAFRRGADEAERMLLQGAPRGSRTARVEEATRAWEEAYWASFPAWEHRVVTGRRPGIYACFNRTHLLVSDVSSVVSDFLASQKPYAVVNTSGLSEADFKAGYPTVRAATILSPDASGVPALLESVRHPEKDTLAQARKELKTHLLGPSEPPSLVRFNQAALALGAQAEARNARQTNGHAARLAEAEAVGREARDDAELVGRQALADALGDEEGLCP